MEEEDGVAYKRGSAMGNDTLALNYSQMTSADAGSVDLVGSMKTLSSGRKKLMTKYFDLEEVESGPLLSEYFAVSLAFVALGAMIREANVRMRRKDKDNSDGVSPKLQRMALDSMLKSAMERLRGLAHRTQTLEEKVRDSSYIEAAFQFERLEFLKKISGLEATIGKHEAKCEATISKYEATIANKIESEAVWRKEKDDLTKCMADVDAQRGYFFKKMAEAEGLLGDMQRLRMEDGKANAKLVEIYAGREQSWKSERSKMRHDIELLKEKLNKLQPQSQTKSSHSFDVAAEALRMRNLKRRAKEMVREKVVSEREFAALVAVEQTPKLKVDSRSPKEFPVFSDDRKDSEGADSHELSAAQNQEMEAELAIILKRVGALKRRGNSGSKLDELLNEAQGKPKLKRLGSFDQAPRGGIVDGTLLCLPEANSVKDVEIDKEGAKDIWQAIEVQEGKNVQRRNSLVDGVTSKREPVRMGFVDSSEFIQEKPNTPENNTSQRPPEGLAVANHKRAPVRMSVLHSREFIQDSTDFTQEEPKLNTPEKSISLHTPEWLNVVDTDRAPESVAVNCNLASQPTVRDEDEPLNADDGGWEEFLPERPTTPEDNVWERNSEESAVANHNRASKSVAVNSKLAPDSAIESLNLDEGSWVESIEYKNGWDLEFKGYSITCAEPGSPDKIPVASPARDPVGHGLDDLILFEDDIKSEILVGNDQLEEAHSQFSSGSQGGTQALAIEMDQMSAESDNPGEIPGVSSAHDPVDHTIVDSLELPEDDIKSEIIASNPISTPPTLDDHVDLLNKANTSEGEIDDVSDNGQTPTAPSNVQYLQTAQNDLNNSTQHLSPDRTNAASRELQHHELNGGD